MFNGKTGKVLEKLAHITARWTGSSLAVMLAVAIVLIWVACGPYFDFSDTWQLVMSTGSSAITCMMVFLLQRSQTKDSVAMQIKLNEIIAALSGENNRLINNEELNEEDIFILQQHYKTLATNLLQRSA